MYGYGKGGKEEKEETGRWGWDTRIALGGREEEERQK